MKVENIACVFLLTKAPKPYEFKDTGKKGISLKIQVAIDGQAYPVKVSEQQHEALKNVVNTPGTGSFKISMYENKVQLSLLDYSLNTD